MISIVVPIYNGELYLEECIQSILSQDCSDWELLLVDDGSKDATRVICEKYIGDSRIHYYNKDNTGVLDTRKYGAEKAAGSYVLYLDADDILHPSAVRLYVSALKNDVDIIVASNFLLFSNKSELVFCDIQNVEIYYNNNDIRILKDALVGKYLSFQIGALYKRDLLIRNRDLFATKLKIGEDLMFNMELIIKENPKVCLIKENLYCYRKNPYSVMHTYDSSRMVAVHTTIQYLIAFVEKNKLIGLLSSEFAFRLLLLWSVYVFHPNNEYYGNTQLRKYMRGKYFSAFKYLYPYLKFYLFVDFFIFPLSKMRKL